MCHAGRVDSFDSVVWQVLTVVLTVVGVTVSVLLWRQRGAASGLRGLAWSLLPAAAYLTGSIRLLWEIGESVVVWAGRLAFSPFTWAGIALLGVSATLFVVSAAMRRRGVGVRGRARGTARGDEEPAAGRPGQPGRPGEADRPRAGADPEMDEIEAILRKHGIS